jgi:hypothetical protein
VRSNTWIPYGVIHATVILQTLQKFHRILKIGGKLYFTANAFGYYVQWWIEELPRTEDHFPRINIARTILNTAVIQKIGVKNSPVCR